jgi:hypothetical protein
MSNRVLRPWAKVIVSIGIGLIFLGGVYLNILLALKSWQDAPDLFLRVMGILSPAFWAFLVLQVTAYLWSKIHRDVWSSRVLNILEIDSKNDVFIYAVLLIFWPIFFCGVALCLCLALVSQASHG